MHTADDVVHNLMRASEGLARRLDDAPTGVEPGYDENIGATFLPNGKVRYRRAGTTAALPVGSMGLLAWCDKTIAASVGTSGSIGLNYDRVGYDPQGAITTGAFWKFTAPADGWYRVDVNMSIAPGVGFSVGDLYTLKLGKNGSNIADIAQHEVAHASSNSIVLHGTITLALSQGDYINTVIAYSGAASHALALGDGAYIAIYGQAATVGTGDTLGDQGSKHLTGASTTATIASGANLQVDYNIADTDPYSQWSGSTFMAALAMTVDVTASLASSGVGSWAGGDSFSLYVKKNNTTNVGTIDSHTGTATGDIALSGTVTGITLAPGDYIEVFVTLTHSGGITVATAGPPAVSINRTA